MPTARQFPHIALTSTCVIMLALLTLIAGPVLAGDDNPLQAQIRERAAHQHHTQIQVQLQAQNRSRLGDAAGGDPGGMSLLAQPDRTRDRDRDRDGERLQLRKRLQLPDCDGPGMALFDFLLLLRFLP